MRREIIEQPGGSIREFLYQGFELKLAEKLVGLFAIRAAIGKCLKIYLDRNLAMDRRKLERLFDLFALF